VEVFVRSGLHDWERDPANPNRLLVDVEMWADDAGPDAPLIDYDRIRQGLLAWRDREHVDLLETLVEDGLALCWSLPRVQAARVRVVKPDIFPEAAAAGVEVFRKRPAGA
jgi:dihydroneopterin aldolase